MERISRAIGPLGTNVHVVADTATHEAIAIDTAIPSLAWVTGELESRGWRLRLIVATHGHWDHIGDDAAIQEWTAHRPEPAAPGETHAGAAEAIVAAETAVGGVGAVPGSLRVDAPRGSWLDPGGPAAIAAHRADWHLLAEPDTFAAPFPIPPCVAAVELAEGGHIRFGSVRLEVLHTPGHTEGSVCLLAPDDGLLFSGDTLFAGGWGRVDLAGGSPGEMVRSLSRLAMLAGSTRVLPGHGPATTIERERPWLELVVREGRLPL